MMPHPTAFQRKSLMSKTVFGVGLDRWARALRYAP